MDIINLMFFCMSLAVKDDGLLVNRHEGIVPVTYTIILTDKEAEEVQRIYVDKKGQLLPGKLHD